MPEAGLSLSGTQDVRERQVRVRGGVQNACSGHVCCLATARGKGGQDGHVVALLLIGACLRRCCLGMPCIFCFGKWAERLGAESR
jgi:hypothetical protein